MIKLIIGIILLLLFFIAFNISAVFGAPTIILITNLNSFVNLEFDVRNTDNTIISGKWETRQIKEIKLT